MPTDNHNRGIEFDHSSCIDIQQAHRRRIRVKPLLAGFALLASANSMIASADLSSNGVNGIDSIGLQLFLGGALDGNGISIGQVEIDRPGLNGFDNNGELFFDTGRDGIWGNNDAGEGDGQYTAGEPFNDVNGDGVINAGETFFDVGADGIAGTGDAGENDGLYLQGEYFIDQSGNGKASKDGSRYTVGYLNWNANVNPEKVFVLDIEASTAPSLTGPGGPPIVRTNLDEYLAQNPNIGRGSHSTQVAGVMISTQGATIGVANAASLFSSAYAVPVGNGQAESLISAQHVLSKGARAINYSFGEPTAGTQTTDGNSLMTLGVDWLASTGDTLNVIAGNEDTVGFDNRQIPLPTDNYNGVTIGFTQLRGGVFRELNPANTFDEDAVGARRAVDLVAPGTLINMTTLNNGIDDDSGTSFAAPHVTATVALLQQYGENRRTLPMADPLNGLYDPEFGFNILDNDPRRHEVMKAVLMNSADKVQGILGMDKTIIKTTETFRDYGADGIKAERNDNGIGWKNGITPDLGEGDGYTPGEVYTDSNGDGVYNLNGGNADHWLNSTAYSDESIPLDEQMGTGQLNARRALAQFAAGEHDSDTGILAEVVPKIGWDFGSSTATSIAENVNTVKYIFDKRLRKDSYAAITLVWDRKIELVDNIGSNDIFDIGDSFNALGLTDLNLFLMPKGETDINNRIVASMSEVDSVEHIFFQIPSTGEYEFWVTQLGNTGNVQQYAVAWQVETIPLPPSLYLAASGLIALIRLGSQRQRAA